MTAPAADAGAPWAAEHRQALRERAILAALVLALGAAVVASLCIGPATIAPGRVLAALADAAGLAPAADLPARDAAIVQAIRLPRTLLGALVGAALAVSGAMMQGLFRNPLADPGLIGVSGGAMLAAVFVLFVGVPAGLAQIPLLPSLLLPAAAFLGGIATTLLVWRLASRDGAVSLLLMVLAGIAVNALTVAGAGIFLFLSDDVTMRGINFWMMGSLGGSTWAVLGATAPCLLAVLAVIPLVARSLDAFLLGRSVALHLGFPAARMQRVVVAVVAMSVGAAVAATGLVTFVGIVVPHMLRSVLGVEHRLLLPASALFGATLLLGADFVARTIIAPAELPLGLVTALVGAPVFLILIRRRHLAGTLP